MHKITSYGLPGSILLLGPVGVLPGSPGSPGTTLDEEFGLGTSDLTTCLSNREDIKIVMQLNKSCRDSVATHPVGTNGKPTGDVSRVVNNIANCRDNRAYALGNYGEYLLHTWFPATARGLTAESPAPWPCCSRTRE